MEYELKKERLYYRSPMPHLMLAADLSVSPTSAALTDAVSRACFRHETLCSRLDYDKKSGSVRFVPRDTPRKPSIFFTDAPFSWEAALSDLAAAPFDFTDGEFVRFGAYPSEDGVTLVCAAAQVVCDNAALSVLFSDILAALSDPSAAFDTIPAEFCDMEALSASVKLPFTMRFMLKSINKTWRKGGVVFSDADYATLCSRYRERHSLRVSSAVIEEETLKALDKFSEDRNLPLCDVIAAAVLLGTGESGIGTAVNIRAEGNRSFTNHSAGFSSNYFPAAETSFPARVEELHSLLASRRHDPSKLFFVPRFLSLIDNDLIDAAWFAAYAGCNDPIAVRVASLAGFTSTSTQLHVGELDISESPILDSVSFLPPLAPGVGYLFGFADSGNSATVTVAATEAAEHSPDEVIATALRLLKQC